MGKLFIAGLPMLVVFVAHLFFSWDQTLPYIHLQSMAFHFSGGVATAWSIWMLFGLLAEYVNFSINPKILLLVFLVSLTTLVGVIWEVAEFALDVQMGWSLQPSLPDTMMDLIMDTLGALTVSLLLLMVRPKKLLG